jgi:hypothetical protein
MLTLVAAVLAYDRARETCERISSFSELRYAMSDTREEKDIVVVQGDRERGEEVISREWILEYRMTEIRGQSRAFECSGASCGKSASRVGGG